jgi:hypothetical protein
LSGQRAQDDHDAPVRKAQRRSPLTIFSRGLPQGLNRLQRHKTVLAKRLLFEQPVVALPAQVKQRVEVLESAGEAKILRMGDGVNLSV